MCVLCVLCVLCVGVGVGVGERRAKVLPVAPVTTYLCDLISDLNSDLIYLILYILNTP